MNLNDKCARSNNINFYLFTFLISDDNKKRVHYENNRKIIN